MAMKQEVWVESYFQKKLECGVRFEESIGGKISFPSLSCFPSGVTEQHILQKGI